MSTLSYSSTFTDVSMFTCSTFSQVMNYVNLVFLVFVLSTFIFFEKRIAFPAIFFFFFHNIYLLAFPNFVKDECLQNFVLSFGQIFFHRVSHYLSSSSLPVSPRNFVYQIGHYDNIISNLFGVNLICVLCIFFCVFFVLICFIILFNFHNQQTLTFFRKITRAFIFRAPLRTIDAIYMPVCLFSLMVFSDLGNMAVGDIVFASIYSIFLIVFLWFSVFLLNSYLHFYIDYNFLRKFGGLYDYVNFFSTSQANQILNNKVLKFSEFKSFNLIRNHSNRQKISGFTKSLVIILTTGFSSQILSLIIILIVLIIEFLIFIILKKNQQLYYYSAKADVIAIISFISLIISYILMIINGITTSMTQVASIGIMALVFLNYICIIGYSIYELVSSQEKDFLWKIKIERVDLVQKKENYINIMKNYNELEDNKINDKYKKKFNLSRIKRLTKRKEMEKRSSQKQDMEFNFATDKYKIN